VCRVAVSPAGNNEHDAVVDFDYNVRSGFLASGPFRSIQKQRPTTGTFVSKKKSRLVKRLFGWKKNPNKNKKVTRDRPDVQRSRVFLAAFDFYACVDLTFV